MSELDPSPDLTSEDIEALEELADLQDSDPALYESIVREGLQEGERQEHGEALLGMIQNATEHRQERDRVLLDAIIRAQPENKQE